MRAACLVAFVLLPGLATAQESRAAREIRLADASLRAVQFIDRDIGWAVGDDGVILNTIDGGKTWERKPTGLAASLRSVCFRSPFIGWAAGRDELASGGSAGVLLYTRDGGETWTQLLPNSLPGIHQIRFVDDATGFLLTDGSDTFPSGLFRTDDGGRSWEPVAGPRTTSWLAGDFQDGKTGVLAGAWSRLATFKEGKLHTATELQTLTGRHVQALQVLPGRLVAAAEGGLVLSSGSGGARWGFADLKLPAEAIACLDFHAMHAVGTHVWLGGRPGSVILHSGDGGASWEVLKVAQPLPLHAIFFFDERHGWAVGAGGTIVATADGGRSWQVQRQAGKRACALVVQAHARDLPADTVAVLGGSEGYLTAALRVVAPEPASAMPERACETQRYAAAARSSGAMTAEALWGFPLPAYFDDAQAADVLGHWDRLHAGQARRELVRQLVLALRVWRPSIVLGDPAATGMPASRLVAEALQEAVRAAADGAAFREQIEVLGLQPWQVSRTYARADQSDGVVIQDNQEPLAALRATPSEHAAWSHLLLRGDVNAAPQRRGYRLIHSAKADAGQPRHWLTGLTIDEGDARRPQAPEPAEGPAASGLAKAVRQRSSLVALAARGEDRGEALGALATLLRRVEDEAADHAALTAFAVASHYAERGQWLLADEAYRLLVERFAAHRLSAEAYRWLIRHAASSEARRRRDLKHFAVRTTIGPAANPIELATATRPIDEPARTGLELLKYSKSKAEAPEQPHDSDPRSRGAEWGKRLASFGHLHAAEPASQFCLQANRRQVGKASDAQQWYARFQKYAGAGPWSEAARGELWLGNSAAPPRRLARCRLTEQRPYLDGNFDDACWQGQSALRLDNAAGDSAEDFPTEAMFAYDQEFLYVALRCRHPEGRHVAAVKTRTRDALLEGYDRISFLFDADRDYATFYHMEVDQRGCVREDCWGDTSWNPRWFIAVNSAAQAWHIEAAIPLAELAAERVPLGTAWAFNVVRIVPGRGVQSWSQPADVRPRPEGMSLLLFQQDAAAAKAPPMSVDR